MAQPITLVTGNPHKLQELRDMAENKLALTSRPLDLDEIQTMDLHQIVEHKARQAFAEVGGPVIVDDVAAGLESLDGLPGPFIRFFNERLGHGALNKLTKAEHDRVTITCLAAYFDGTDLIVGEGVINGTIVPPRGEGGFGFDNVVVPDGIDKTMAELSPFEKMQVSHRGKAFRDLLDKLAAMPLR